ncbi:MAG: hypothetical protein WC942_01715 [Clostridia bacterium]|jgi:hypothetical protein
MKHYNKGDDIVVCCPACNTRLVNAVITETNDDRLEQGMSEQFMRIVVKECFVCHNKDISSDIISGSVATCGASTSIFFTDMEYAREKNLITFRIGVDKVEKDHK